jgi:hypothetical protein
VGFDADIFGTCQMTFVVSELGFLLPESLHNTYRIEGLFSIARTLPVCLEVVGEPRLHGLHEGASHYEHHGEREQQDARHPPPAEECEEKTCE